MVMVQGLNTFCFEGLKMTGFIRVREVREKRPRSGKSGKIELGEEVIVNFAMLIQFFKKNSPAALYFSILYVFHIDFTTFWT